MLLEKFGMVDCNYVLTLMELNFKKLSGNTAGLVLENPTEYLQLIGALMFLVNTRLDADPLIHQCKRELAAEFEIKDLGLMH